METMLSPDEKKQIEAAAGGSPLKRAAAVEALQIVQRRRGWISDEALREVAGALAMTPAEVDSLATSYDRIFRRPVGRHVIWVCDSVSCWIMGYENLLAHLKRRLGIDFGQTTGDGRFTLLPHACLGACDRAPVMMIDDRLHGPLDAEKIDAILRSFE
jgi:NADH-quinone oxidoreductase subunit E